MAASQLKEPCGALWIPRPPRGADGMTLVRLALETAIYKNGPYRDLHEVLIVTCSLTVADDGLINSKG